MLLSRLLKLPNVHVSHAVPEAARHGRRGLTCATEKYIGSAVFEVVLCVAELCRPLLVTDGARYPDGIPVLPANISPPACV